MIAPSRKQRADMGPAGYKDSMSKKGDSFDMSDDGGQGPMDDDGDNDGDSYTLTVPASCLMEGQGSGDLNPGDTVDFDAEATIVDVQGDKVTIKVKTINGEACDGSDQGDQGEEDYSGGGGMGGNTRESTADMGARLRAKAGGIQ